MNKKLLESYQANKRLIQRNNQKIESEQCKEVPVVMGKISGSMHDFPYIPKHFTVQMDEPVESDRISRHIRRCQKEIEQAEKDMEEVEQFINSIDDAREREILTYRYIDGMKVADIARKVGYTKGRVSQIITKSVKD